MKGVGSMSDNRNLKETICQCILNSILNYEYKPNQILTEKELVAKYGCSKSPVREALVSLCNDGVLRNIPRCGYEVIRLTIDDVVQIQDYRRILECGILRQSYKKITPSQIAQLRRINEDCSVPADIFQHWESVTNFHLHLMFCSQNQFAYAQLQRAMAVLGRAYAQCYWNRWDNKFPPLDTSNHSKILDHLEAGDIDQAIQSLHDDLNDFDGKN